MKRRQVAVISPEFPPLTNWGGVATFNDQLSRLLSARGYEVHCISYNPSWQFVRKQQASGGTHHLIGFKTNHRWFNVLYHRGIRPILVLLLSRFPDLLFFLEWNFYVLLYMNRLLKEHDFVAIHAVSYHSPALLIRLLHRSIPLIVHIQGPQEYLQPFIPGSLDSRIKARLESFFSLQLADVLVSCNRDLAITLGTRRGSPAASVYIPNFIVPSVNRMRPVRKDTVVYWGRIEHRKGIEPLVTAFSRFARRYPKATLWLIGTDEGLLRLGSRFVPLHEYLFAQDIPESVRTRIHHIPGISEKAALRGLVQTLNGIAVFPSLFEPFGFVNIEAMSWGIPTIGSTRGESARIITDGATGFLCEPSAAGILRALQKVRATETRVLAEIRAAAQREVRKKYSVQAVMSSYRDLYRRLGIEKDGTST